MDGLLIAIIIGGIIGGLIGMVRENRKKRGDEGDDLGTLDVE